MLEVVKKIDEVYPNVYNPNVMDEAKYNALKELIEKFGYLQPILITREGMIIDGEHRWKAMQELGCAEISCVVFEHENDADEYLKLVTIAMNSIRGEHDGERLHALLKDISFEIDAETISRLTTIPDDKLSEIVKDAPISMPDINMADVDLKAPTLASYPMTAGKIHLNLTEDEHAHLVEVYEAYVERYKVDMGFVFYLLGIDA